MNHRKHGVKLRLKVLEGVFLQVNGNWRSSVCLYAMQVKHEHDIYCKCCEMHDLKQLISWSEVVSSFLVVQLDF